MPGKCKKLCKWEEEEIDRKFKKYCKKVGDADYVCKKCGRAASTEEYLCKPAPAKS